MLWHNLHSGGLSKFLQDRGCSEVIVGVMIVSSFLFLIMSGGMYS